MIKIAPHYVDNLWYPVVVRDEDGCSIVEMQGKTVNQWCQLPRPEGRGLV